MDYNKHYALLIEKTKERPLLEYSESHHIIPKCVGGLDNSENLVALTPEEHFLAHLLLTKIYPGNSKLIFAANMMGNRCNKRYGWLKRKFSVEIKKQNSGYVHSESAKSKMSFSRKNKKKTEEHKKSISEAKLLKLEYNGVEYLGYTELLEKTGISYHLYNKYYLNGIDPVPFVKNNTHGMRKVKNRAALGKHWYNNGVIERYHEEQPQGWIKGRLTNDCL